MNTTSDYWYRVGKALLLGYVMLFGMMVIVYWHTPFFWLGIAVLWPASYLLIRLMQIDQDEKKEGDE